MPDQPELYPPADRAALRDRMAEALRGAACEGGCGDTEEECVRRRVQPCVWHHGVLAEVLGTPEVIADAVLAVLPEPDTDPVTARSLALLTDKLVERCPDHGCVEPGWEDGCHCEIVPLLPAGTGSLGEVCTGTLGPKPPQSQPDDRRARYAAAIDETSGWVLDGGQHMVDAVMAVANEEQQEMANATVAFTAAIHRENARLRAELEQALAATQPGPVSESEAPYPTSTTWTVEAQKQGESVWFEVGDHYTSEAARQHAAQFRETTRGDSIRVVRQVVTTTVEPGGQAEDGAQQ
ncbi:hypothetical protein [Streptomyces scopuliridis]|uniref:hypothetical protein n=1 Tax=Streptomyces scopuliridis TaxID=452529 RepID=UPI00341FEDE1